MRNPRAIAATLCALVFVLFVSGCSDSTPTGSSSDIPTPITGTYFIQAKINGKTETMQEQQVGLSQTGEYFHGSGDGNTDNYFIIQRSGFQRTTLVNFDIVKDLTYRTIEISLVRRFAHDPYGKEIDSLLLSTGPVGFGSIDSLIDGVEIRWTDASNTIWSSAWGTGDQSGSAFTVTSREAIELPANYIGPRFGRYTVKGTFNCELYDGKGNSLDLTNGTFHLRMVHDM